MDASYEDYGPLPHFRVELSLYYIIFFIVFPFFFVNILVALIIITFQEQGEKELEEGEIDKNQKSCIDFAIGAKPLQRYIPKNKESYKYKIWRVVVSTAFEYFIMSLIVMNTILLMMKVSSLCKYILAQSGENLRQWKKFERVVKMVGCMKENCIFSATDQRRLC